MSEGPLLERAAQLTAQLSWVRKYRTAWLNVWINAETAATLLEETSKPDRSAYDFLDSVKSMAREKCAKLEKWIEKHEREQNIMMQEVDPDVKINR